MNEASPHIGVIGAGAWGTALAVLLVRSRKNVILWARDTERAAILARTRENPRLPNIVLPPELTITHQIPVADILLITVPTQNLRVTLAALPKSQVPLILCCKGIEEKTLFLPHEIAKSSHTAILTGPNFAHEIARGLPGAAVLATSDGGLRQYLIDALKTDTMRLYGSADILGASLGGAAKNVIAIAAGAVTGAGLGENARAALITRGLAEIARLALALGGRAETISGLSGLGDLLLTCTGAGSRNFSLGAALGRGEALTSILASRTSVTEGVTTAPALLARAKAAGVDMPVTQAVTKLLSGEANFAQTMNDLMGRALREE